MTDEESLELDALRALNDQAETVEEFIARVTPKYAPLPWHLRRLAEVYDAARDGEIAATVELPVRMGKTETTAHALAQRTLYDPSALNFYSTFGSGLSMQTSRKVRKLARAAGVELSPEAQAVNDWRTTFDGGLKATSVGGDVTGRGCKGGLVVADDLLKGRKEAESLLVRDTAWDYLRDDLMSRMEPGSSIVIVAARWHHDDVIGRIKEQDQLGFKWIHLVIPAVMGPNGEAVDEREEPDHRSIWPEVWDLARLARIRMRGEYGWWSLYQQRPTPKGGGTFPRDDWQYVDEPPAGCRWVRRWDLAASTDPAAAWTAGVKMGEHRGALFIADVERGQWGPAERDRRIVSTARRDGAGVTVWLPQDPGQAGLSQRPHYGQLLNGFSVRFERESVAKEVRWDPYASQVQARNVHLVRAPWNRAFVDEHSLAPAGRIKDQIDAAAGGYYALIVNPTHGASMPPVGGSISDDDAPSWTGRQGEDQICY